MGANALRGSTGSAGGELKKSTLAFAPFSSYNRNRERSTKVPKKPDYAGLLILTGSLLLSLLASAALARYLAGGGQ